MEHCLRFRCWVVQAEGAAAIALFSPASMWPTEALAVWPGLAGGAAHNPLSTALTNPHVATSPAAEQQQQQRQNPPPTPPKTPPKHGSKTKNGHKESVPHLVEDGVCGVVEEPHAA